MNEKKLWIKKMQIVKKNINWIKKTPFIKTVLLSGSLARKKNIKKNSDIDFFIIFEKNRIFTGRFFLVLRSKLKTFFIKDKKNKLCFNHFCTENLNSISEKNLYTAMLFINFLPVIDDGFFEKFKIKNNWIKKYFKNGNTKKYNAIRPQKIYFLRIFGYLEFIFMILQKIKILLNPATKYKNAKIIFSKNEIGLHPEPKAEKFIANNFL